MTRGPFAPRPTGTFEGSGIVRPNSRHSVARASNKYRLDKNENPDPELATFYTHLFERVQGWAMGTYPELGPLYDQLALLEKCSSESLALTTGCDGAIHQMFEVFVAPTDKVIITEPTFAMYSVYAAASGAQTTILNYEPKPSGPWLSIETILDSLKTLQPKVLFLANPNSPTGTTLSLGELEEIAATCKRTHTIFFVDEAYYPFASVTATPLTESYEHVIVARTFSKAWGLAGLRLGYVRSSPRTIAWFEKARPMYEIGAFPAEFLCQAIKEYSEIKKSIRRLIDGKKFFVEAMRARGFAVLPSGGNFTHVDFGVSTSAVHSMLDEIVLYRSDWTDDCLKGFTRISSAPVEIMREVVSAVDKGVEQSH